MKANDGAQKEKTNGTDRCPPASTPNVWMAKCLHFAWTFFVSLFRRAASSIAEFILVLSPKSSK
jgi:hypothetical protein